jgi:uncharacterized protein YbjT (DUF2867 family)
MEATMRLLVFGATGGTGREVVGQALEQGHQVSAYARRPEAVTAQHPNLTIAPGDVLDAAAVHAAVAGHDAVVSALGTYTGDEWVLAEGTTHICAAMQQHGVRRFICITTLGVGESSTQLGHSFAVLSADLREVLEAKAAQEQIIFDSGLAWTIVRPGALTNGPRSGVYRCVTDPTVPLRRAFISRADVADFIVRHLADDRYVQQAVSLTY